MKIGWLLLLTVIFGSALPAAGLSGTWKAAIETPGGTFQSTFVFKVDGSAVTGTTSNEMTGEAPVTNGRIDGDNVLFTVTFRRDNQEFTLHYKGKLSGNELRLTVEIPGADRTFEMTAQKVS